jgi:hypothetical protein
MRYFSVAIIDRLSDSTSSRSYHINKYQIAYTTPTQRFRGPRSYTAQPNDDDRSLHETVEYCQMRVFSRKRHVVVCVKPSNSGKSQIVFIRTIDVHAWRLIVRYEE